MELRKNVAMISKKSKSESPFKNKKNMFKDSQFMLNNYSIDNDNKTIEILNYLDKLGIIEKPLFDRIDIDDWDRHAHYFFDFKLKKYNTLSAIINNYIEKDFVNIKLIEDLQKGLYMSNKITMKAIWDEKFVGFDADNKTKELIKDNLTNFTYINKTQDKEFSYEIMREGKALKGISSNDKPENILNNEVNLKMKGVYDYTFNFDKDLKDLKGIEESFKTNLLKEFKKMGSSLKNFNDFDYSLTKLNITKNGNKLRFTMNNLLKSQDENINHFYMISVKNMKSLVESALTNVSNDLDIDINYKNLFYTDKQKLDDALSKTIKQSKIEKVEVKKIEIASIEPKKEIEPTQQEVKKPEVKKEDEKPKKVKKSKKKKSKKVKKEIEVDFEKYKDMTIEEVESDLVELNELLNDKKLIRFGIISDEKLSDLNTQKLELESVLVVKQEEERINNLVSINEDLTLKIEELEETHTNKVLELNETIEELKNGFDYEIKELKEEYTNAISNLEELQLKDLNAKDEEIEQLKNDIITLNVNNKGLKNNLESKDTTIKNLKQKNKDLVLDVEDLNNQIINVKDYNTKEIENLEQDNTKLKGLLTSQTSSISAKDEKIKELDDTLKQKLEESKKLEDEISKLKLELEEQKTTPEKKTQEQDTKVQEALERVKERSNRVVSKDNTLSQNLDIELGLCEDEEEEPTQTTPTPSNTPRL